MLIAHWHHCVQDEFVRILRPADLKAGKKHMLCLRLNTCLCTKSSSICRFKVLRLYPPNEGSLAGCEPPVSFEPRTHRLRGWTVDFPSQVPRPLFRWRHQSPGLLEHTWRCCEKMQVTMQSILNDV